MAGTGGLSPEAAQLADLVDQRLPHQPVVIALSGGADSAALAWAASIGRQTRAVTVDHGLEASARLVTAAVAIAGRLEIPHQVVTVEAGSASETALREGRLAALEGAVGGGELVATGHTADDQAETILSNALRGAGLTGMSGIPVRRGIFVRPLLEVRRQTTRAVATELGLPFVDDPANDPVTVRRNRLRHVTIPALEADYNPALVEALGRLADVASSDDALIEERAARVPVRRTTGGVIVPAAPLQTLPRSVAARVVRRAVRDLVGPHAGSSDDVAAVLRVASGGRTTIGGGVDVERVGPWVVLSGASTAGPESTRLSSGTTRFGDWEFTVGPPSMAVGRFAATIASASELEVRWPRRGDRIAVRDGTKTVRRALAEARIPEGDRARWPVISDDGTIVWIPGVRVAADRGEATHGIRARRT